MPNSNTDQIIETSLYEAILDDISSGRIAGGQRLKVSELAQRYGVSASPVRETLRQMQGEGFIDIEQNKGAVVKRADANTIQNIFESLQLLEPYFVIWFAEHAEDHMLERIQAIQEQMRINAGDDTAAFRKLDTEFHGQICSQHYNSVAADVWKRLRGALNVHAAPLRISPGRLKTILEEHDALVDAFQNNDPRAAEKVIRKHLEGSFTQMSQQLRALGH